MATLQDESSVHDTFKRRRFLLAAICTLALGVAAGAEQNCLRVVPQGPLKLMPLMRGTRPGSWRHPHWS